MKSKRYSNPLLRHAAAPAIWLFAMGMGQAIGPFYFDKNAATAGSGIVDGGTYVWNHFATAGQWVDGTNAPVSVAFNGFANPVDVNFVSTSDAAGKSYTVTPTTGNMYISSLTVNSGNLTIDLVNNPNFFFTFGSATATVNDGASLVIKKGSLNTVKLDDRALSMDVQGTATASVEGFTGGNFVNSALTKTGTGSLFVNGASDYVGVTTVNGGTLKIQNASAVSFGGAVGINRTQLGLTVTPGAGMTSATLDLNGNATFNKPITLNGTAVGGNTASLINSSAGTTAVVDSGVFRAAYSNAGGSSFSTTDSFTIAGGGGSGATVNAALRSTLATFVINDAGSGYVVGNTITVNGGGATTNAVYTVTAVDGSGAITGLGTLTTAGIGYTSLSGLTYVGAKGTAVPAFAGTGATLTPVDGTFQVNSINMVNAGTGYTSTPTLTGPAGKGFVGTAANSTFTLTGSQNEIGGAGNLNINTAITGATAGFAKIGAGTLTLNGVNTYGGATAVNGGKLNIGSTGTINSTTGVSIGAGEFSYHSATALSQAVSFSGTGGTLSGTGTIPAVTVSSGNTLAPGSVGGIGTLSAGSTVLAGTYACDLNAAASDALAVTGALNLTGATLAVNALATPAAASYIIATCSSGITGNFAGLAEGATLTISGVNYTISYAASGGNQVTLTQAAASGYSGWASANGATGQTVDQDHDNDGVRNGIEYFMGQSGSTFTANPTVSGNTVTWPMGATYSGTYGIDYLVQTSDDLNTWTAATVGVGAGFVAVNPAASVIYTLPTGSGKLFVRLLVNPN
jgi:autotransporter-associated beta strand protein